jgi:hypothetical protein
VGETHRMPNWVSAVFTRRLARHHRVGTRLGPFFAPNGPGPSPGRAGGFGPDDAQGGGVSRGASQRLRHQPGGPVRSRQRSPRLRRPRRPTTRVACEAGKNRRYLKISGKIFGDKPGNRRDLRQIERKCSKKRLDKEKKGSIIETPPLGIMGRENSMMHV